MDMMMILMLVGGLALLTLGGEFLVRGSSKLAALFGISPLVIGLTVVAFGTSSPELAVSVQAGFGGNPDIAVGNVIGSNIFNVLLILGMCAVLVPLTVSMRLVRIEVPLMIAASVIFLLMGLDGRIGFLDGALLFGALIVYLTWSIRAERRESKARAEENGEEPIERGAKAVALNLGFVAAGLGLLVLGADWLVTGAVAMARDFGVSELVIGLTIVAAGTSLPEVAASIAATIKGERDMAIGNVVGSNLFNILCIIGLASMVTPGGLTVSDAALSFDMPVMIAVAVACLPIFFTGYTIYRWEGALFLASYVAYVLFLIFSATQNPALETLSNALIITMPLVVIVLGWTTIQAFRRGDHRL
ncbi:MAG: calcium/sodium antiporter [Campylobacterales bacterium]